VIAQPGRRRLSVQWLCAGTADNLSLTHGHRRGVFLVSADAEDMNETDFRNLAKTILDSIEQQIDAWFEDLTIDVEGARNGSMLTLKFANHGEVVINSQAPIREIWVAIPGAGFHCRREADGHWYDIRTADELGQVLSRICSDYAATPITVFIP
jgi:CyaY protein